MTTISITKENALKAFRSGNAEQKKLLQDLLGPQLSANLQDRIKTFEDICAEAGEDPADYLIPENATQRQVGFIAAKKVLLITEICNEGWEPDYSDSSQLKYEVIYTYKAGSGFSFGGCDYDGTYTFVGARLCFFSSERAKWTAETFQKEFNQFLTKTA